MKTIIKITTDNYSQLSFDYWKETFTETDQEFYIEISNKNYLLPCENKHNKEEFENSKVISAKGYSQGEWQDYKIYFNGELPKYIETALKHTFTHKNEYFVTKYEQTEIDGKVFESEILDSTGFCIDHIEFPTKEEIENEYLSIYGKDFDELINATE
jgi:hypothetical protein